MSVELNKLNRAGFGGGTTGVKKKSSGIASQATKNLANSSAASKSSIFSVKSSNKFHFTAGVNNVKNMHKANYQGVRASLNSRTYTPSNTGYVSSASSNVQYNVQNGMSKAMMTGQVIGQIAGGVFGLLNQTGILGGGDKVQTQSNTKQLDQILSGGNNHSISLNSSSASSAISGMQGATDSASLRTAIGSAETQLGALNSQTSSLEAAASQAQSQLSSLEQGVSASKDGVSKSTQALSNAKNTTTAKERVRDSKQNALQQADSNYGKATANWTKAHDAAQDAGVKFSAATHAKTDAAAAYSSAKSYADSLPKTIKDANGNQVENPAYKKAQDAADKAKTKYDEAIKAETDAKKAYETAKKAEETAKGEKDKAFEALGDKKEAVKQAESDLQTAQKGLDQAKEREQFAKEDLEKAEQKLDKAEQDLNDANGKIEKLKSHQQDVKTLQKEIEKQKERLTKLEKQEQNDWQKNDIKASKGIAKNGIREKNIHGEVDTARERRLSDKIDRTNDKVSSALNHRDSKTALVDQTYVSNVLTKKPPFKTVNGQKYYMGTNPTTNNTVYARDGQLISKEDFEKAVGVSA